MQPLTSLPGLGHASLVRVDWIGCDLADDKVGPERFAFLGGSFIAPSQLVSVFDPQLAGA